jgi:hypothetical protein
MSAIGPIIFDSVDTFIEAVGRRQVWRYAELDQMSTIFTGPSSLAMRYKPKVNQRHPEFPLMFCTDSRITRDVALVAEINATYAGIMDQSVLTKRTFDNGQTCYTTSPVWTISPVQGSRDFQVLWAQEIPVTKTTSDFSTGTARALTQTVYFVNAGTRAVTVRYIGSQATCKYQLYMISSGGGSPPPELEWFSADGLSRVSMEVLSTYYGQISIAISGADPQTAATWYAQQGFGVPPLFAAFLGSSQQQRGYWYDVTEVYGPTF